MKHTILAALAFLVAAPGYANDTSLDGLKARIVGSWTSVSCELRPSTDPANPDGKPIPTYLTRDFTYEADSTFAATITVFGDQTCQMPLISYDFAGEIKWHGPNPAAEGAWSQDYVLNQKLVLTPLAQPMTDQLNALPENACGTGPFETNKSRDILGQPCALLRFVDGSDYVIDHDLLYVREDAPNMLFMGGKHVDGSGFYVPENRPSVGLQQPLIRTGS